MRTWVYETDEDGELHFDNDKYCIEGKDTLFRDGEGSPEVPLGTTVIYESKAPDGYELDTAKYVIKYYHVSTDDFELDYADVYKSNYDENGNYIGTELVKEKTSVVQSEQPADLDTISKEYIKDPQMSTTALSVATNSHTGTKEKESKIQDTISYEIYAGGTYYFKATYIDGTTEEELGTNVSEKPIEIDAMDSDTWTGEYTMPEYTIDGELLAGHTIYVKEELFYNLYDEEGNPVIDEEGNPVEDRLVLTHDSVGVVDQNQAVWFPDGGTKAYDGITDNQVGQPKENETVFDDLELRNIVAGYEYTATASLHYAEDFTDAEGNEHAKGDLFDGNYTLVNATVLVNGVESNQTVEIDAENKTATFTAPQMPDSESKASDITLRLEFSVDSSNLQGTSLVFFEDVDYDGVEIFAHADVDDTYETIYYPKLHTMLTTIAGDGQTRIKNIDRAADFDPIYLVDTVSCENLIVGYPYKAHATLMDKTTGNAVMDIEIVDAAEDESDVSDGTDTSDDTTVDADTTDETADTDTSDETTDEEASKVAVESDIYFYVDSEGLVHYFVTEAQKIYMNETCGIDGEYEICESPEEAAAEMMKEIIDSREHYSDYFEDRVFCAYCDYDLTATGTTAEEHFAIHEGMEINTVTRNVMVDVEDGYAVQTIDVDVYVPLKMTRSALWQDAEETTKVIIRDNHNTYAEEGGQYVLININRDNLVEGSSLTSQEVVKAVNGSVPVTCISAEISGTEQTYELALDDGAEVSDYKDWILCKLEKTEITGVEAGSGTEEDASDEEADTEDTDTEDATDEVTYDVTYDITVIASVTETTTEGYKAHNESPLQEVAEYETGTDTTDADAEDTDELVGYVGEWTLTGNNLVTTVCEEELSCNNELVGEHKDLDDEGQTVDIPEIGTTLVDAEYNTHITEALTDITLVDTVHYENLHPGESYTFSGILYDKETGEPMLDDNGNEITAEVTDFVPTERSGDVKLTFNFSGVKLKNKTTVAYETVTEQGQEVALHADINDAGQTVHIPEIGTTLVDDKTEDHIAYNAKDISLTDTVHYENLFPETTYKVEGILYDKETGEPMKDDNGKEITASKEFTTPSLTEEEIKEGKTSVSGDEQITFKFSGVKLAGHTTVAYETVYYNEQEVAAHADIDDEGQTVYIPEMGTTLTVDGAKEAVAGKTVTLVDTINYKNLIAGKKYTVKGVIYDKSTGKPYTVNGKEVTGTATFTASKSSGTATVNFTINTAGFTKETTLVAYEELYLGTEVKDDKLISEHKDINDADQTVKITLQPKTGDTSSLTWLWILIAVLAACGIAGFTIYNKKVRKNRE